MDGGWAGRSAGFSNPDRVRRAAMTPGARLLTAIELFQEIEVRPDVPADAVVNEGFRARRYAGAKDRRAVAALVYGALRRRAQLDWWLARAGVGVTARTRLLAFQQLSAGLDARGIAALCQDGAHVPAGLDSRERFLAGMLEGEGFEHVEQSAAVSANAADWLHGKLVRRFGSEAAAECAALGREAPVDLRVNTLKADRDAALAALRADKVEAAPTPWSPVGLRLSGRLALGGVRAYRDGLVELQDEGSQLAALLVDAQPGMTVVDYCAGAGGKTLSLAAQMRNEGRILACDTAAGRLKRARERLARAGATIAETRVIGADGSFGGEVPEGLADRVLVDAPCSGVGVWRRRPEDRWRLTEPALAEFVSVQDGIFDRAARLVRPGGRMVYVTCSLLTDENEDRIAAYLARRADFRRVDIHGVWKDVLAPECPATAEDLVLTPARHGVDGFYVCVMERPE